ncbi:unnamed protein product, partial [Symbiodinium necroappetens]
SGGCNFSFGMHGYLSTVGAGKNPDPVVAFLDRAGGLAFVVSGSNAWVAQAFDPVLDVIVQAGSDWAWVLVARAGGSTTCMVAERVAQEYVQAQVWEEQTKVSNVERARAPARIFESGGACDVVCATDCGLLAVGFAHDKYEPAGQSPVSATHFEEVKSSRKRVRH